MDDWVKAQMIGLNDGEPIVSRTRFRWRRCCDSACAPGWLSKGSWAWGLCVHLPGFRCLSLCHYLTVWWGAWWLYLSVPCSCISDTGDITVVHYRVLCESEDLPQVNTWNHALHITSPWNKPLPQFIVIAGMYVISIDEGSGNLDKLNMFKRQKW